MLDGLRLFDSTFATETCAELAECSSDSFYVLAVQDASR